MKSFLALLHKTAHEQDDHGISEWKKHVVLHFHSHSLEACTVTQYHEQSRTQSCYYLFKALCAASNVKFLFPEIFLCSFDILHLHTIYVI